jgi:hypothetical protein
MAGANPPHNRMDAIVVARYDPLNYIPMFKGEGGITTEEQHASFYSYVDSLNIYNGDVWMRFFVQSLDGEARKWFRSLAPKLIVGIEALDDAFLSYWGDKKDFL